VKWLDSITQLCTGIWVGSMTGFAFTAPMIFAAFGPDRQRAGNLAGEMIFLINKVGLILGAIALAALLPRFGQGLNRWRTLLMAGALATALFGTFYIFPNLTKAQPPRPIQEYAETDPVRVAYTTWHERSRQVFSLAILMGAGVIVLGSLGKETR
jgi:MFS family permease